MAANLLSQNIWHLHHSRWLSRKLLSFELWNSIFLAILQLSKEEKNKKVSITELYCRSCAPKSLWQDRMAPTVTPLAVAEAFDSETTTMRREKHALLWRNETNPEPQASCCLPGGNYQQLQWEPRMQLSGCHLSWVGPGCHSTQLHGGRWAKWVDSSLRKTVLPRLFINIESGLILTESNPYYGECTMHLGSSRSSK
jgi:hypothetical protein